MQRMVSVDWPVRYKEIAPWYDYVGEFAGISGAMRRTAHNLPDSHFLPPMDMNVRGKGRCGDGSRNITRESGR